jgi:hypothetical protein
MTTNFETMKKISSNILIILDLKAGREFLLQRGLVPNLLKNVANAAKNNNPKGVIAGLALLDNMSKIDEGKAALRKHNALEEISKVCDLMEKHEKVIHMAGKIFSKISSIEDLMKELKNIEDIQSKKDYSESKKILTKVKPLEKSVNMISNFILVEDINKVLNSPENQDLLVKVYEDVNAIDLNSKPNDYFRTYLKLNKDFMITFNRMHANNPNLYKNEKLVNEANTAIEKNFDCLQKLASQTGMSEELQDYSKIFNEFFSSYADVFSDSVKDKEPSSETLAKLLKIVFNF